MSDFTPKQRRAIEAAQKRAAKAKAKADEMNALKAQCAQLSKVPPEFQQWGVIKTRAWRRHVRPLITAAKKHKPGIAPMKKAIERMLVVLGCNDTAKLAEMTQPAPRPPKKLGVRPF